MWPMVDNVANCAFTVLSREEKQQYCDEKCSQACMSRPPLINYNCCLGKYSLFQLGSHWKSIEEVLHHWNAVKLHDCCSVK